MNNIKEHIVKHYSIRHYSISELSETNRVVYSHIRVLIGRIDFLRNVILRSFD